MSPALLVAIASVIVLAWCAAATAAFERDTRRRFPPEGPLLDAGGFTLHALREGTGPVVVLIHGADGVAWDFPAALRSALARDHTVLAFDRPGHGWSGRGRGTLDLAANADALRAAVRSLGAGPVILAGHSYGTLVALRWALDAPEDVAAVVALAPAAVPYAHGARWLMPLFTTPPLAQMLTGTLLVPLGRPLARLLQHRAWHPDPRPGHGGAARAFPFMPSQFRAFAENVGHVAHDATALVARYPEGRTPLLIVAGEVDRVTPAEMHAVPLERAWGGPKKLIVLPHTGHMMLRTRADEIVAAVAEAGRMAEAARTRG